MSQPKLNSEISALSKLIYIGIVIIAVIVIAALVTGGAVYWWQKNIQQKERAEFQQEILRLQNEIKVLKANSTSKINIDPTLNKNSTTAINQKTKLQEQAMKDFLANREKTVITLIKNHDFINLSKYVHPQKGLRFSPYTAIDSKKDLRLTAEQVRNFFRSNKKLIWGYSEDNGMPVKMNSRDYYRTYIYDQEYAGTTDVQYLQAAEDNFNGSNCFEVYPQSIAVEFRVAENQKTSDEIDWYSLKLVFEESNKIWYLVGIIHDRWLL